MYNLRKLGKKAQAGILSQAPNAVIILVVIAVVIGVGATVLDEVQETQTSGTAAFNASEQGLAGLTTFSDFQPTIAVIVVAVIIIGLLLGGFAFATRGGGRR